MVGLEISVRQPDEHPDPIAHFKPLVTYGNICDCGVQHERDELNMLIPRLVSEAGPRWELVHNELKLVHMVDQCFVVEIERVPMIAEFDQMSYSLCAFNTVVLCQSRLFVV